MTDGGRHYDEGASPFKPKERAPLLARTIPVPTRLAGYPERDGRHDLVAGITVAALALPSAMAYAELAGLSPVAGLYALLLPAVAYAFLGSSRQLIVGPEGALALLVATSVAPLAHGDATTYAALAAMLGLLFADSRYVKGRIREAVAGAPTPTRFLVVDALDQSDITLVVTRLKAHLDDEFESTGLRARIGPDHFFGSVDAAVAWCRARTDRHRDPGAV